MEIWKRLNRWFIKNPMMLALMMIGFFLESIVTLPMLVAYYYTAAAKTNRLGFKPRPAARLAPTQEKCR